jgi:hypothetical protein
LVFAGPFCSVLTDLLIVASHFALLIVDLLRLLVMV